MGSSNIKAVTPASALGQRKLPSWIDGFFSYTKDYPSPPILRRWAAIAAIAGAIERKVFVRTGSLTLYPNLYVVLVAPPGVGKTVVLSETQKLWRALSPNLHVAPNSLTKAALMDALFDAKRRLMTPGLIPPWIEFNSLAVASGELGVLLPAYDNEFMNALTDLYDGHPYEERRRSRDIKFKIDFPNLNILAATTPSYLSALMPEGAWDQGFVSRTMLVYSGDRVIQPLFGDPTRDKELFNHLVADLKIINNLYGEIIFEPEAAQAISAWHLAGGPPIPEHPKLQHYLTRRTTHLLKLCVIASISNKSSLLVTMQDYELALAWLLEIEEYMPDIFKAMNSGGDSRVIDETWFFVYKTYMSEKMPVAERRVITFLQQKVPSHQIQHIIGVMTRGGMLIARVEKGFQVFIPGEKNKL